MAMLEDESEQTRRQTVKLTTDMRNQVDQRTSVRKLNFQCGSYTEMISWNSSLITEPPLTKKLKDDQLIDLVNKPLSRGISVPHHFSGNLTYLSKLPSLQYISSANKTAMKTSQQHYLLKKRAAVRIIKGLQVVQLDHYC